MISPVPSRSSRSHRGWALPATLAALILLTTCVRLMGLKAVNAVRLLSTTRSGDSLRHTAHEKLFEVKSNDRGCSVVEFGIRGIRYLYQICSEGIVPFVTKPLGYPFPPERIDYESVFKRASPCRGEIRKASSKPSDSPISMMDCIINSGAPPETILLDNILSNSLQVPESAHTPSIIATPGRLLINETLLLSGDILILTGGDIEIASMASTARQPIRVSLISSLGGIRVRAVGANISLLTAGRSVVEAPDTPPSTSFPLPPFRPISLYGFKSLSSTRIAP